MLTLMLLGLSILLYRVGRRLDQRDHRAVAGGLLRRLARDDSATASVSFILTLPIFLIIFAMILQLALVVNAALAVNYAAFTGARSAIVSLPPSSTNPMSPVCNQSPRITCLVASRSSR